MQPSPSFFVNSSRCCPPCSLSLLDNNNIIVNNRTSFLRRRRRRRRRRRNNTTTTFFKATAANEEVGEEDDYDEEGIDEDNPVTSTTDNTKNNLFKFNVALAFDEDEDDYITSSSEQRALISSFHRMRENGIINEVFHHRCSSSSSSIADKDNANVKTVILDFGSSSYLNEIRGDKVYVKVFDNKDMLVGKKGKLVSLLPPSLSSSPSSSVDDDDDDDDDDVLEKDDNNGKGARRRLRSILKLITTHVLQNKNIATSPPQDFLAYHLFASSLGAFKKRSGALYARRKIKDEYLRLCSKMADDEKYQQKLYIFFNLNSQTSKWNAAQVYESLLKNKDNYSMTIPIPVALVYGDNENETIERSTCVWIFRNPNDFYQCVYADSWREAETLVFGKKNNKNSWPEKFRSNLLLDFPRKKRKEDSSILSTPSTITVAAFAQNFASQSSVVFIAPGMSEKNNNHKNDCTLRKLFQSAGITFTGTSAAVAARAADRVFLSSALAKLKIPGVMGIPKKVILQSALTVMAEEYAEKKSKAMNRSSVSNIQRAVRTYAEATKELNCAELCIKSQFFEHASFNDEKDEEKQREMNEEEKEYVKRVTRIQSAKDLETFAYDSRRKNTIAFSNNIQNNFVLEPFVETGKVVVESAQKKRKTFQFVPREEHLSSSSSSRWLKIYAGGIGPEGKMKALDPTCPVSVIDSVDGRRRKRKTYAYLDCVTDGKTKKLLFVKIESVVKARIERVLNATGISGVAMLRCFVNVDSGELIVEDVDHSPDMTERNGTFYHQALRYFHREESDDDDDDDEDKRNSSSSSSTNDNYESIEALDKIGKGLENTSFFTRLIAIAMWKKT